MSSALSVVFKDSASLLGDREVVPVPGQVGVSIVETWGPGLPAPRSLALRDPTCLSEHDSTCSHLHDYRVSVRGHMCASVQLARLWICAPGDHSPLPSSAPCPQDNLGCTEQTCRWNPKLG